MASTVHFGRVLHSQRSTVTSEFFDRTAGLIFEKEHKKTRIEARCWTNSDLSQFRRDQETSPPYTLVDAAVHAENTAHNQDPTTRRLDTPHLVVTDLDLTQLRRFIQVREPCTLEAELTAVR
jgi:hypothetical protein